MSKKNIIDKIKPHAKTIAGITKDKSKEIYNKTKPHVKTVAGIVKDKSKEAYQKSKPHVKNTYTNTKIKSKELSSKAGANVKSLKKKRINKKALFILLGVLVIGILMFILFTSSDDIPQNAQLYKFPDEREFNYPELTPVECPSGVEQDCSSGFFKPSNEVQCPISCDDDNDQTIDECSAATNFQCVNRVS